MARTSLGCFSVPFLSRGVADSQHVPIPCISSHRPSKDYLNDPEVPSFLLQLDAPGPPRPATLAVSRPERHPPKVKHLPPAMQSATTAPRPSQGPRRQQTYPEPSQPQTSDPVMSGVAASASTSQATGRASSGSGRSARSANVCDRRRNRSLPPSGADRSLA